MKIDIEVNNKTQSPVADDFFVGVANETIEVSGYDFLQEKKLSVSVALVSKEEIQKLNKQCRQKDDSTDILSFFEFESIEEIRNAAQQDIFLGELILCYDDIKEYAESEHIEFEDELAKVFSHGILHLLGFSHSEKMFSLQKEAANNFLNKK